MWVLVARVERFAHASIAKCCSSRMDATGLRSSIRWPMSRVRHLGLESGDPHPLEDFLLPQPLSPPMQVYSNDLRAPSRIRRPDHQSEPGAGLPRSQSWLVDRGALVALVLCRSSRPQRTPCLGAARGGLRGHAAARRHRHAPRRGCDKLAAIMAQERAAFEAERQLLSEFRQPTSQRFGRVLATSQSRTAEPARRYAAGVSSGAQTVEGSSGGTAASRLRV